MLSYRHSYHAGNYADVLKHIVIIEILEHLLRKDSAFDYFDTHAGAGLYDLRSEHAEKLQEYTRGVGRLIPADWPELSRYFEILGRCNPAGALNHYPGSPAIAMDLMRSSDRAWLYEMHPKDYEILAKNTARNDRVKVIHQDGFKGLLSLLPPSSRRGLVLIDPSYEMNTDYRQVVDTVIKACKRFATGIYAIWYPVVDRSLITQLEKRLIKSGIKNIQLFELGVAGDRRGRGMTATGMIVINPPWQLLEKMTLLLPRLVDLLSEDNSARFRAEVLAGE